MDKDVLRIYTMEYYSAIKNNKIMSFAVIWMDPKIVILSDIRQRETDVILHCLSVEYKTTVQMRTYLQNRNSHICRKETHSR